MDGAKSVTDTVDTPKGDCGRQAFCLGRSMSREDSGPMQE